METSKTRSIPKPSIVLVSGYKRSGKDSAAEVLTRDHDFKLLKFAGPIKKLMVSFFKDVYGIDLTYEDMDGTGSMDRNEPIGSNMLAGKPLTLRWALQWFGTNIIRNHVGSTTWSNAIAEQIEKEPDRSYVISDCRFPDEEQVIQKRFGKTHRVVLIRINRPGTEPGPDAHVSETAMDDMTPRLVIENVGRLKDLEIMLKCGLKALGVLMIDSSNLVTNRV